MNSGWFIAKINWNLCKNVRKLVKNFDWYMDELSFETTTGVVWVLGSVIVLWSRVLSLTEMIMSIAHISYRHTLKRNQNVFSMIKNWLRLARTTQHARVLLFFQQSNRDNDSSVMCDLGHGLESFWPCRKSTITMTNDDLRYLCWHLHLLLDLSAHASQSAVVSGLVFYRRTLWVNSSLNIDFLNDHKESSKPGTSRD